jgi:hypothetical protein
VHEKAIRRPQVSVLIFADARNKALIKKTSIFHRLYFGALEGEKLDYLGARKIRCDRGYSVCVDIAVMHCYSVAGVRGLPRSGVALGITFARSNLRYVIGGLY